MERLLQERNITQSVAFVFGKCADKLTPEHSKLVIFTLRGVREFLCPLG